MAMSQPRRSRLGFPALAALRTHYWHFGCKAWRQEWFLGYYHFKGNHAWHLGPLWFCLDPDPE